MAQDFTFNFEASLLKPQKPLISFVIYMSICVPALISVAPTERVFVKFYIVDF